MKLPLLASVPQLVNELLSNKEPQPFHPEDTIYLGDGNTPPFRAIEHGLLRLMKDFDADKPRSDGLLSVHLHKHLPLTRREAAEMKFWHYMTLAWYPRYVAWRYFDPKAGRITRERYLGALDRNAFSRLWWWAELTIDRNASDPYHRTLRGADSLEMMKSIIESLFGGHPVLVAELIDTLFAKSSPPPDALVKQAVIRLNAILVTVAVDVLNPPSIRSLVRQVFLN